MAAIRLKKIWSNSQGGEKVNLLQEIKYHFIAFEHLALYKATLLCHTYAGQPIHGRAGDGLGQGKTIKDALQASLQYSLVYACRHGERSVWTDDSRGISRGITIFLEILTVDNKQAVLLEDITHLISAYQSLANKNELDAIIHKNEVKFYVCSVFSYYWFENDPSKTPNPDFGTEEAVVRADVVEAQGYRALRSFARMVDEIGATL